MNIAFLLAAGRSQRFGTDKSFAKFFGKSILGHSLQFLEESKRVDVVYVAASASNKRSIEALVKREKFHKVKKIFLGGRSRFESVRKGLAALPKNTRAQFFIIHNAANPMVSEAELKRCFTAFKKDISGVAVGRPVTSALKHAPKGRVHQTLSRADVWEMETPQVVRAQDFFEACKNFFTRDFVDDIEVLEVAGRKTLVVPASPLNRKITTRDDLDMLKRFVQSESCVGIGEDGHRFKIQNSKFKDQHLVLGGVTLRNFPPLEADSDGDVVLHSLCNAIASAVGKRSLGTYATAMCKVGVRDSRRYLEHILREAEKAGFRLTQCSVSIEAGRPKIDPLVPRLKKSLSLLLGIPAENIGITATTGGGVLSSFGRGEGIRCQAVVLLHSCLPGQR